MRVTRRPFRICDGVLALVWSPVVGTVVFGKSARWVLATGFWELGWMEARNSVHEEKKRRRQKARRTWSWSLLPSE